MDPGHLEEVIDLGSLTEVKVAARASQDLTSKIAIYALKPVELMLHFSTLPETVGGDSNQDQQLQHISLAGLTRTLKYSWSSSRLELTPA